MQNKNVVVILTIIVSLICLYSLSFTYVSQKIQREATVYATDTQGLVNAEKKEHYQDSLWEQPVYHLLGYPYTFRDVKEKELNLGLDLQGGMYVVMQVSPVEILRALANNHPGQAFQQAVAEADQLQKEENEPFINLFYQQYKNLAPDVPLRTIFANSRNQDHVNSSSSDAEVLDFIREEINGAVDRSFEIIRNRIDRFGVAQPTLQQLPGTERIQLEMPGVDQPERVRKLLQGVAKLEFRQVMELEETMPYWQAARTYWNQQHQIHAQVSPSTSDSLSLEDQLLEDTTRATSAFPLLDLSASPYGLAYALADTATISETIRELQKAKLLPEGITFLWEVKPQNSFGQTEDEEGVLELFAIRSERNASMMLAGDVVIDAAQSLEEGKPSVVMQMNTEGSRKWKKITAESIGRRIAIVVDDQVYSAPVVQSEIPNGRSSIAGNFTLQEAQDLANILKAGKMPAPVQIVEEAVVGPSLGAEAIAQGVVSMAAGLSLVVLFMMTYYAGAGVIANIALLFNIFFIIGVLAQLGAALTLPGIAGLVLTVGMSVDANVLIFERIKEELKQRKPLKNAVKIGYDKAYSAIIDSNATTFLTGAILYYFGSGGIKGFAVVLMIGIVSSLFTAVFLSRLMMEYLAKRGKAVRFGTALSQGLFRHTSFDFIGKRKWAYRFSSLVILIGLVSILLQGGLNVGVDFKGGRSYVVRFDEPVAAGEARSAMLTAFEGEGVEVKTFNQANQLKITTSYLAHDHSGEADQQVQQAFEKGLQGFEDEHPEIISSTKVGATIAKDVKDAAQSSVICTLVVIFLYILLRFRKWQYGLGAVVALFHDVLMVFAAYAMARVAGLVIEVDQVFIAAILTIVGYSINDTVVVFDRIREFSHDNRKYSSAIYNQAINDTLSRTVVTSLTVFIVVVILLIFGGEVLRGFSFALLVGVVVGTYSSIFIAAPLALDAAQERKKPTREKGSNRELHKV
uniref:Multifunctional fusion protein n=1 Tax=Roseihalotalea indica TaxID=2867963 RepID=A0AA49JFX4_9BACT|nr:protein translocase subunit SecDF [Tunicatimonas sp. TK19036]